MTYDHIFASAHIRTDETYIALAHILSRFWKFLSI